MQLIKRKVELVHGEPIWVLYSRRNCHSETYSSGWQKKNELVHSSRKPIAIQYIGIKFSGSVKLSHKLSTLSTVVFEAPSQTQSRGKCCKQGFPYPLWPSTKVKEKGLR